MVVLDATMLMLFFRPDVAIPVDEKGIPIKDARDRVDLLIETLHDAGVRIAIPTPALSEVLVRAGVSASQQIVEMVNNQAVFSIEPFDQRAAIEVAAMLRDELPGGKKKLRAGAETWAKVKYDRQIVAIAKVIGADAIYSDDDGIGALATRVRIPVTRVRDLPRPPIDPQHALPLEIDDQARLVASAQNPRRPKPKRGR